MNCLQSRRLLLAAPREQSQSHRAHVSTCERCSGLVQRLGDMERSIESAALVPVPDALVHRILLRRRTPGAVQYAAAAAVVIASVVAGLFATDVVDTPGFPKTIEAVGPTHPAVVAIAEAVAGKPAHGENVANAPEMEHGLKRLGLSLKPGKATAHYVGQCRIEGASECQHIVLSTQDAQADVMLVPDYPLTDRVMVLDRRMVALVTPAGEGGYIVVADSAKVAKRMDKLFVKGEPLHSAKSPKGTGVQNRRG
ncbi:MAG: DUF3379 family protein [Burkholderiales bacterium]